jgi:putative CocE/NonD family hydrolase
MRSAAIRTLEGLFGLPPSSNGARCVRDLPVPMRDGVVLLADRWHPDTEGGGDDRAVPTLLVRSPYGRRSFFGFLYGRLYAQRGFQVVVQSCRGTFGSGGDFEPMLHEADDAADTVAWLREQPWFGGAFATMGASYLCFTQWALARARPPELRAMVASVGPHEFGPAILPGGALALDTALGFAAQVSGPPRSPLWAMARQVLERRRLAVAFRELPLVASCRDALGQRVPFLEDWLIHDQQSDPYWTAMDHTDALDTTETPVLLQGGWYDLFADVTISQYETLRRRGQRPYLTMGAWTHRDFGSHAWRTLMPETLAWLRVHLGASDDDGHALRSKPVRIFVLGADEWREYDDWPPPGLEERRWHLQPDRRLGADPPTSSMEDRYRYDPTDPTPSVGGALLFMGAGPRDNRELEARPDVLTYTSDPLEVPLTIFGAPRVELCFDTTLPTTDVFVRLCDVAPDGRSRNICDVLRRVSQDDLRPGGDGGVPLHLDLAPTACRFARGHRLRLQVSSGAHPRFARNPGTGDPTATATALACGDQVVRSAPGHASSITVLAEAR